VTIAVKRTAALLPLAAALSAGCAAVLVRPGDAYQRESAYIYGRFLNRSEDGMAAAFSIRCRDDKRYKIVFSKDEPLRMIRLPAGVCQLEDVVYKGAGSMRDMASLRLIGNEHLEPGGVYYVGDFVVAGRTLSRETKNYGFASVTTTRQMWEPFNPRNNYATTTAAMKQAFPGFAAVATEDRMARQ
jgi:hypothetical protein